MTAGRSVSLLVPVFNEEKTIGPVLDRLAALPFVEEIVVVNDGSADGSDERIQAAARRHPAIKTARHARNQGKGAAIRTGLDHVTGTHVVIQDADLEYDPAQIESLLEPFEDARVDAVFGSRFLLPNPNLYRMYLLGNKFMTVVLNLLGGGRLTDAYTCYKCMPLTHWKALDLSSRGFEIEAEITIKALMRGWRIVEKPVSYNPRRFEEGKKIRGRDAWKGVRKALACRMAGVKGCPADPAAPAARPADTEADRGA